MTRCRPCSALALFALMAACDSGGDATAPPDPTTQVATVEVLPPTTALAAPATVQLTAVARTSQGAEVAGQSFLWASSNTGVATVSQTGLVTSVAGGTATITATTAGKQGQAQLTVVTSPLGPAVDVRQIGAAGGTVGNQDVAVTIPPGALTATRTLVLARDTALPDPDAALRTGSRYLLDGLPSGETVSVRVRVRAQTSGEGVGAILASQPAVDQSEGGTTLLGGLFYRATDSAGHYVATVPITGRPALWVSAAPQALPTAARVAPASSADLDDLAADALLELVLGMEVRTSPSGRFEVWRFGPPGSTGHGPELELTAALMDQAYAKVFTEWGYDAGHRKEWPMQVRLVKGPLSWRGAYVQPYPFPFKQDRSYIELNEEWIELPAPHGYFPSVVMHELYHFAQAGYLVGHPLSANWASQWLKEAASTWAEPEHPDQHKPFTHWALAIYLDSLYVGLSPDLKPAAGYGKAPIIQYIARYRSIDRLLGMWKAVQGGADPVTALLAELPNGPEQTWPDVLSALFGDQLYSEDVPFAPSPPGRDTVVLAPGRKLYESDPLAPLGVHSAQFKVGEDVRVLPDALVPVYLDQASVDKAKLLVYRKNDNLPDPTWDRVGTRDTVAIFGEDFLNGKVRVLVTPTEAVAPYREKRKVGFRVDLGLTEGDWFVTEVDPPDGEMVFPCSDGKSVDALGVANNVELIWNLLSRTGTWKRNATPEYPATYGWAASPTYQDSLLLFGVTLESELRETTSDTVIMSARMRMLFPPLPAGSAAAGPMHAEGMPPGLWWVVALAACALTARNRRARRWLPASGIALAALLVWSCDNDIMLISFEIDQSVEQVFTRMTYTNDPLRESTQKMSLYGGAGTFTVHKFTDDHWYYIKNPQGTVTDSVHITCSGTGTQTYAATAVAYRNGFGPPASGPAALSTLVEELRRGYTDPGGQGAQQHRD